MQTDNVPNESHTQIDIVQHNWEQTKITKICWMCENRKSFGYNSPPLTEHKTFGEAQSQTVAHFEAGIQTNQFDLATRGFHQVISNQFVYWISQFFDFTVYFTTFWNKFSWKITIQLSENSQKCLNNSKIWENCAFWMPRKQKAMKRSVHFVNNLAWFFTSIDHRIINDWPFHSSKEKGKQIFNIFMVFYKIVLNSI